MQTAVIQGLTSMNKSKKKKKKKKDQAKEDILTCDNHTVDEVGGEVTSFC